jgi:hypothetical protein
MSDVDGRGEPPRREPIDTTDDASDPAALAQLASVFDACIPGGGLARPPKRARPKVTSTPDSSRS